MNFIVWSKVFFDWQTQHYHKDMKSKALGKTNILLQENTSKIKLERYGKQSSTKRTRHINIRYFYMIDKLQDKTVTAMSYCPMKDMVADYFSISKLLKGTLFRVHQNSIIGLTEADKAWSYNDYMKRVNR